MADEPRGASLAGKLLRANRYLAQDTTVIYRGDFVEINAAGKIKVAVAASTHLMGVALGHKAAGTTGVLVADHPDQLFYVQDDGAAATYAAADIGTTAALVVTAGNSTLLKSQHELDVSTKAVTKQAIKFLGAAPGVSYGKNMTCLVMINYHHFAQGATGI